jgi:hypothetical protein
LNLLQIAKLTNLTLESIPVDAGGDQAIKDPPCKLEDRLGDTKTARFRYMSLESQVGEQTAKQGPTCPSLRHRIDTPIGALMFVRRKVVKEKHYFQVVENHRVGGRVRQVILASLGAWPSVTAARAAIPQRLQDLDQLVAAKREVQVEADSRRPWPRYTRSGQMNWRLVHQRAGQEIRRLRHEITRLTSLLQDIQELEEGVTK